MGAHHRRTDPGAATERPAFDEVAHGYDPRQVDDYLATLWRYASQVTSRAAAAESALRHERERNAGVAGTEEFAAQAGGRIGQMLAIAQREADEIIDGARQIAESALEEVIEDAGANHPIVREAREQAEKLLLDAVEESRRLALERHRELADEIARSSASLDTLRHQQGEIIGAVLRLRRILGSDEVDRAVTDLARAGTAPPEAGGPGDPAAAGGFPTGATPDGFVPGASAAQATGGGFPGGPETTAPTVVDGPTMPSTPPVGAPPPPPRAAGNPDAATSPAAPGQHGPGWPGAAGAGSAWEAAGVFGASGGAADAGGPAVGAAGPTVGAGAAAGRVAGRAGASGLGRRPPGRHRQGDVADAEPYPVSTAPREPAASTAGVPFRRGADEDIIDAEIVEE
ncbi:hypothetical protein [Frankia sp. QA3]|uniref:hypothetical protein n=1 Tax=Frankia sp. QA3 TaxID=710111 RepID=UPI000269BD8C|nr:hypothetical protein [Frankia sp. QA3]EIV91379.1 hypothetical protein FraQA3DRAFT_0824 [Frankia sp. QA3]